MKSYEIFVEVFLGMSHCGSIYTDGTGTVSLTDSEIETLFAIMENAKEQNLKELDLESTELKETHPELYRKLFDAYCECESKASLTYWVEGGYFGDGDVDNDWDDIRQRCIDRWGYKPEIEEEDVEEDDEYERGLTFHRWFDGNFHGDKLLEFELKEEVTGVEDPEFEFSGRLPIPPAMIEEYLKSKGE